MLSCVEFKKTVVSQFTAGLTRIAKVYFQCYIN